LSTKYRLPTSKEQRNQTKAILFLSVYVLQMTLLASPKVATINISAEVLETNDFF
jgi:hypothetical protein